MTLPIILYSRLSRRRIRHSCHVKMAANSPSFWIFERQGTDSSSFKWFKCVQGMAEAKRIELTTVGPLKKDRKPKEDSPTYRFQLTLGESNEKTCPEYSYLQLLKTVRVSCLLFLVAFTRNKFIRKLCRIEDPNRFIVEKWVHCVMHSKWKQTPIEIKLLEYLLRLRVGVEVFVVYVGWYQRKSIRNADCPNKAKPVSWYFS